MKLAKNNNIWTIEISNIIVNKAECQAYSSLVNGAEVNEVCYFGDFLEVTVVENGSLVSYVFDGIQCVGYYKD